MVQLNEIMAIKSSRLLLTRNLLGKPVQIIEDLPAKAEIRQTTDGRYFAISIKINGEIRDWHPTAPQLKAVVAALNRPDNLKGKAFQITEYINNGYHSKTTAVELLGDYAAHERAEMPAKELPQPPARNAGNAQPTNSDLAVFLGAIDAQPGKQVAGDDDLDALALLVCNGDATKANFVKNVAKASGRIRSANNQWSVAP